MTALFNVTGRQVSTKKGCDTERETETENAV